MWTTIENSLNSQTPLIKYLRVIKILFSPPQQTNHSKEYFMVFRET